MMDFKVADEAEVTVIPQTTILAVFLVVIQGGIAQTRVPIVGHTVRGITQVLIVLVLSKDIKQMQPSTIA